MLLSTARLSVHFLSSSAYLRESRYSVISTSLGPHMTTSSANTITSGTSFLTSSVSTPIIIMNKIGLSADPWCSKTSSLKLIFLQPLFHILGTYPIPLLCTVPGPDVLLLIATLFRDLLFSCSSPHFFPTNMILSFFLAYEYEIKIFLTLSVLFNCLS